MEIEKFKIEGLCLITPKEFKDSRGLFYEAYNEGVFDEHIGYKPHFVQDNISISHKDVLRGLHFQRDTYSQGKMVRVLQGSVLDVAVDIRPESPTYGQYETILLSGKNKKMFWVPEGFAHGFISLEDNTQFHYKCTNFYNPDYEGGIIWNDSHLNIDWGTTDPIISQKDTELTKFDNIYR